MTRRARPVEGPSLFDLIDEETGDRTPGIFRAPAPTRARRATPLPPPDGVDWAARGAEYREKWAASTAAARARIEGEPDA